MSPIQLVFICSENRHLTQETVRLKQEIVALTAWPCGVAEVNKSQDWPNKFRNPFEEKWFIYVFLYCKALCKLLALYKSCKINNKFLFSKANLLSLVVSTRGICDSVATHEHNWETIFIPEQEVPEQKP